MSRKNRNDGTTIEERRAWRILAAVRLKRAIRRTGYTRAAVERASGIPPGTLGHMIAGRRGISWIALVKLAGVMRVRAAWLVFGESPAWWELRQGDRAWGISDDGTEGWLPRDPWNTARFTDGSKVRMERVKLGVRGRIVGVTPRDT